MKTPLTVLLMTAALCSWASGQPVAKPREETVAADLGNVVSLSLSREWAYYSVHEENDKEEITAFIRRVPQVGGEPETVLRVDGPVWAIRVTDTHLYFSAVTDDGPEIARVELDGKYRERIATPNHEVRAMDIDLEGQKVYWRNDKGIYRSNMQGGIIEEVVKGLYPVGNTWGLTYYQDQVYFDVRNGIMSAAASSINTNVTHVLNHPHCGPDLTDNTLYAAGVTWITRSRPNGSAQKVYFETSVELFSVEVAMRGSSAIQPTSIWWIGQHATTLESSLMGARIFDKGTDCPVGVAVHEDPNDPPPPTLCSSRGLCGADGKCYCDFSREKLDDACALWVPSEDDVDEPHTPIYDDPWLVPVVLLLLSTMTLLGYTAIPAFSTAMDADGHSQPLLSPKLTNRRRKSVWRRGLDKIATPFRSHTASIDAPLLDPDDGGVSKAMLVSKLEHIANNQTDSPRRASRPNRPAPHSPGGSLRGRPGSMGSLRGRHQVPIGGSPRLHAKHVATPPVPADSDGPVGDDVHVGKGLVGFIKRLGKSSKPSSPTGGTPKSGSPKSLSPRSTSPTGSAGSRGSHRIAKPIVAHEPGEALPDSPPPIPHRDAVGSEAEGAASTDASVSSEAAPKKTKKSSSRGSSRAGSARRKKGGSSRRKKEGGGSSRGGSSRRRKPVPNFSPPEDL